MSLQAREDLIVNIKRRRLTVELLEPYKAVPGTKRNIKTLSNNYLKLQTD